MKLPLCPPCPRCHKTSHVVQSGDRNHVCGGCKITFNHDPQGDSEFHRDPTRLAELVDERRFKRQTKYGRRY